MDVSLVKPSEIFDIIIDLRNENSRFMRVNKPGIYKLLHVSDSRCTGEILAPYSKSLFIAHPPTVKIETIPIPAEDCPGEVGVEIILSLTGNPPW